jgi:hypothetical protein
MNLTRCVYHPHTVQGGCSPAKNNEKSASFVAKWHDLTIDDGNKEQQWPNKSASAFWSAQIMKTHLKMSDLMFHSQLQTRWVDVPRYKVYDVWFPLRWDLPKFNSWAIEDNPVDDLFRRILMGFAGGINTRNHQIS